MQTIPLQAVPSQTVTATLGGQATRINVYTKTTGLYADVLVNDARVIGGVVCQNGNFIIRDAYLGFIGDLVFYDMQQDDDPDYTGLGTRFMLHYIEWWQIAKL